MGRRERNKWRNGPTRRLKITPTMRGEMSHILLIHRLKMGAILYSHLSVLILTRRTSSDAVACASQPTYARENFHQSHRILSPSSLSFIRESHQFAEASIVSLMKPRAAHVTQAKTERGEKSKHGTALPAPTHAHAGAHGVPLELGHISILGKLSHDNYFSLQCRVEPK